MAILPTLKLVSRAEQQRKKGKSGWILADETYANRFSEHYRGRRADSSVAQYKQGARNFDKYLGVLGRDATQIKASDFDDYVRWLIYEQYSAASIHNYLVIANLYIKWVRTNTEFPVPEMMKPILPRHKKKRIEILPGKFLPSYEAAARQAAKDPIMTAMLLLPMTGLRVSEMCHLRIKDVEISPPSEKMPFGAAQIHVTGKGDKYRKVPVLADGLPILVSYLVYARPQLPRGKWLFPHTKLLQGPIERMQVSAQIAKVKKLMGLSRLHPHLLRHTYGTVLNEAGVSAFDLAEIMGHGDIKTTSIYVHPVKSRMLNDVSQLSYKQGRTDDDE